MNTAERFLERVSDKNPIQRKYIAKVKTALTEAEWSELDDTLCFFTESYDLDFIVDAYLMFVEDTLNETKFFLENGARRYRYGTVKEVADSVYQDEAYMTKYMLGLQVSGYIWENHLKIHRWFLDKLGGGKYNGDRYLEIGPGHGKYFADAIALGKFRAYHAIDFSPASCQLAEKYLEHRFHGSKPFTMICDDFLTRSFDDTYDFVCLSEVLEHVEAPDRMLQKIGSVLSEGGALYVNVPINAPAIDHINLYRSIEDVEKQLKDAGFHIEDTLLTTANDYSLEKAIKRAAAINYVAITKKG